MRKSTLFIVLLFLSAMAFSQVEIDMEREFIYKGRHYVPKSPWVTFGLGASYNIDESVFEPNIFIDGHIRVYNKHYAGLGFLTSREQFLDKDTAIFLPFSQNNYGVKSFHLLYGMRIEKLFANFGFFAGPSINWGYDFLYTDSANIKWSRKFLEPGIYANAEFTYKFYYDMGVGISIWTNLNKSYQVVGASMHIYLSTAFKRQL